MDNLSEDQMRADLLERAGWILDPERQEETGGLKSWPHMKITKAFTIFRDASRVKGCGFSVQERGEFAKAAVRLRGFVEERQRLIRVIVEFHRDPFLLDTFRSNHPDFERWPPELRQYTLQLLLEHDAVPIVTGGIHKVVNKTQ
jgi:hypothetical protein